MNAWLVASCLIAAAWLAPVSFAHAQSEAPIAAPSAPAIDPASAAERDAVRSEREISWGLYAVGGTLLTAGGFTTFGAAFPGVGFGLFYASLGVAGVGFVLFISAITLGTDVHRRTDALRARGVSLAPGPGDLGLGLALRF